MNKKSSTSSQHTKPKDATLADLFRLADSVAQKAQQSEHYRKIITAAAQEWERDSSNDQ